VKVLKQCKGKPEWVGKVANCMCGCSFKLQKSDVDRVGFAGMDPRDNTDETAYCIFCSCCKRKITVYCEKVIKQAT